MNKDFSKEKVRIVKIYEPGEEMHFYSEKYSKVNIEGVDIKINHEDGGDDSYHWGRQELVEYGGVWRHFKIYHLTTMSEILLATYRADDTKALDEAITKFFEIYIAKIKEEKKVKSDSEYIKVKDLANKDKNDDNGIFESKNDAKFYQIYHGRPMPIQMILLLANPLETKDIDELVSIFFDTYSQEMGFANI